MVQRLWIILLIILVMSGAAMAKENYEPDKENGVVKVNRTLNTNPNTDVSDQTTKSTNQTTESTDETTDSSEESNSTSDKNWITILDIADPIGDDHGPGTYLYPTNPQFDPHEGLLDIEHFKADARGDHIRFQITFGRITNPWKMPCGFSHQLIEIYIDHRPGGSRRPYYPGANIVFSPKAPWDTMLKVTGRGIYLHHANEEPPTEPELYSAGKVRVLADQKTIEITIPMGGWINLDDLTDASFYLLVGGQDGFGPDNFRAVKDENHEWYFSGGNGSGYAPNIIDTVTPKGKTQQQVLGSFDPRMKLLAVLEPVHRPNPVRLGLVYFVAALVGFLLWYGWHKRDKFIKEQ